MASATKSGTLDCSKIGAEVLTSSGPVGDPGIVTLHAAGWHFTPGATLSILYAVLGTFDPGSPFDISVWLAVPTVTGDGSFTFDTAGPNGDNCIWDTTDDSVANPTLQTTNLTFTMTASDGTHSATATGVLKCSLLAP